MIRISFLLAIGVLLAACASGGEKRKLDERLYAYAGVVRWGGDLMQALEFVAPDQREALTPSTLEQTRLQQYQVAGYYVQGTQAISEEEVHQLVEIRLVNRHTQVERNLIDRQVWRWDDDADTWWLTSKLPQLQSR